ncbi:CcmD family protein [Aquibacillus salsiterrae]|uniref:CcmD family protein n=1 Tax=Aquibacillus salsiterrae TaxID=2950439 RepID=A0A9X3WE32_9BACI|nr:CcmD family protein [Aquibacillus salsiterrae]MDC3418157.1 CcmD family protein [Aquibacillus salsiterrae]
MTYLVIAVMALWIGILTYMGRLYNLQKKVAKELKD